MGVYAAVIVFLIVTLLPFYWIFVSSITPRHEIFQVPPNYLPRPTLGNYVTLVTRIPFLSYLRNSAAFSAGSAVLSVATGFLAAYAFARIKVQGGNFLLWAFVMSMALPEIVTVIPLFQVLKQLQLINTVTGLAVVMGSVLTPFTVWTLVSFIHQVPREMEEAAIIDGASLARVFWHVVLPVMKPAIATLIIINFITSWNNLIYPLVFTANEQAKTLTVSITEVFEARNPYGRPWELISSLGVTMVVPMIVLVFLSQRAIVAGLTRGSVR